MKIAAGTEVYKVNASPVVACGTTYSEDDLNTVLSGRISSVLWDDRGMKDLERLLSSVATTAFSMEGVKRALSHERKPQSWRVGEALAEVFLVDHRDCEFPWPSSRDLKNPNSSPAGSDLVGFHRFKVDPPDCRFVFSEVKTSAQKQWPPSVMQGQDGMGAQLETLRSSAKEKEKLVAYLGHHAQNAPWKKDYLAAALHFFKDSTDVSIFGVLVRDVEPKPEDLSKCANDLSAGCPAATSVELRAMYLPTESIETLGERALKAKGTQK